MPSTDPTPSVTSDQLTRALGEAVIGYGAICLKMCNFIYFRRR
jgi:hypothetical protein